MNHYSETTQHQLTLGRVMMEAYAKTAYPNSGTLASLIRECSAGEQQ